MRIKNHRRLWSRSGGTFFLSVLILALFLFPLLVFFFKIPFVYWGGVLFSAENFLFSSFFRWCEVLFSTLLQAGLSAILSVLFGVFGALGLCAFFNYKHKWMVELFCLLPALLPPLVSVLAWVNVSELFFRFPFSFYSVLAVHVLMNMGLVSVFFFRLLSTQTGALPAWAFLHGVSRWLF